MSGKNFKYTGFPGNIPLAIFARERRKSRSRGSFILLDSKELLSLESLVILHGLNEGLEKLLLLFHALKHKVS